MNLFGVFVIVYTIVICNGQKANHHQNQQPISHALHDNLVRYRLQHYPTNQQYQQVIDYPGNVYSGQNVAYAPSQVMNAQGGYPQYQSVPQYQPVPTYRTISSAPPSAPAPVAALAPAPESVPVPVQIHTTEAPEISEQEQILDEDIPIEIPIPADIPVPIQEQPISVPIAHQHPHQRHPHRRVRPQHVQPQTEYKLQPKPHPQPQLPPQSQPKPQVKLHQKPQPSAAHRFQLKGQDFIDDEYLAEEEQPIPVRSESEEERLLRLEQARNAHYSFGTSVDDGINDHSIHRQETREGLALRGMYSYSDGFFKRTIHYKADENGYRVVKEVIEPIGDGPQFNPDGTADIQSNLHNNKLHYQITANDFVRPKNKTAVATGQEHL